MPLNFRKEHLCTLKIWTKYLQLRSYEHIDNKRTKTKHETFETEQKMTLMRMVETQKNSVAFVEQIENWSTERGADIAHEERHFKIWYLFSTFIVEPEEKYR